MGLLIGAAAGGSGGSTDTELAAAEDRAEAAEEAASRANRSIETSQEATQQARADLVAAQGEALGAKAAAEAEVKAQADKVAADAAALVERERAVGIAETEAAANTFPGDGTFIVGDDIQPGTYKSAGGSGCYWARQDQGGETIDNYIGDGATVVTVRSSDFALRVARCAPFTKTG